MKNSYYTLILFLLILSGCNKDDDSNPSLPPATQTGAGTFACYVNGKPFIDNSGGYFNCFYQYVDGGYHFAIQGKDRIGELSSLLIGTNNRTISEGEVLTLVENQIGNAGAGGFYRIPNSNGIGTYTNSEYTGELTITKFDFQNNVVSGTFWFDLEHPVTGERVEVRDGRFDTLFTQ